MKKLLVLSLFLFSVSLYAQSTIDFETVGADYTWTFFANSTADSTHYGVVDNPSKTGINTSAKCFKFVVVPAADPWAGMFGQSHGSFQLNANNSMITIMVYKDVLTPFNLKLEPPAQDHNVTNSLTNQWEKLTFDYSAAIGTTVNTITIIPDFPASRTAGSTNYFDNIEFIHQSVPVELTSFSATSGKTGIELNWTTATEKNNKGFEILKGNSDNAFRTIAFVDGKGTTTSPQDYRFVDQTAVSGKVYYRLRQVDFDGTSKFSKTIEVGGFTPTEFELSQNFPNPFNPTTTIQFSLPSASKVSVKVFDMLGKEVATVVNDNFSAGVQKVVYNASNLASGMYIYQLNAVPTQGSAFTSSKMMTILK